MNEEPAEVAAVRPGEELDWAALERYLRGNVEGLAGPFAVEQFPNGSANLTYRVTVGERRLVVRRPPFGEIAPGAHDMRREHTTLASLWRAFPRAPRALAFCDDHAVIGSDFLVVEYRPGVVVWGAVPSSMADQPDAARRIGFAVVDALADLHLVDPAACGLDGLGKPDGFLERQVAGWRRRWERVGGDAGALAGRIDGIGEHLTSTMPTSSRTAVLHNDFKVDNCQFAAGEPDTVVSVFDWDMATLGDPMVDLGILLNYWPDPSDRPDARAVTPPGLETIGLPTRREIVDRYAERTGHDVGDSAWYEAFAAWKTIVVLQQLHSRWLRGESTDPRMAERGELIPPLVRRATSILAGAAG
ncbi:phosphotransferase family protein [Pseudonocardia sp. D17]|uniref:phosphotransferase family protein n=1 Tax=Pseudonocardia sp. D17 TaxID=882661 RepID=UPI002B3884CC|nr:aminoglycoside phosphotransferase [Pseudonocardia sp. D17]